MVGQCLIVVSTMIHVDSVLVQITLLEGMYCFTSIVFP